MAKPAMFCPEKRPVMDVSVVIRTYNEQTYLGELLTEISQQESDNLAIEVVLVDSGSTDKTLAIAEQHGCKIIHINKDEFTFGRSLNIGCEAAHGEMLVFVSGHCVPASPNWLVNLVAPLREQRASYCYGNQIGRDTTKFSERQVFDKYFHPTKRTPQPDYFVNNANAALLKSTWLEFPFDEQVTGLEDMHLGKQLIAAGQRITYAEDAPVFHIHDESWQQVRWRYEREAIALQQIDPSLHMSKRDLVRCIVSSIFLDFGEAVNEQQFFSNIWPIIAFRVCQYWGSYSGSRASRKISESMKTRYFYPQRKAT